MGEEANGALGGGSTRSPEPDGAPTQQLCALDGAMQPDNDHEGQCNQKYISFCDSSQASGSNVHAQQHGKVNTSEKFKNFPPTTLGSEAHRENWPTIPPLVMDTMATRAASTHRRGGVHL